MLRIADLVSELESNCGSRLLVAVAVYPRNSCTGELDRIDQVLTRILCILSENGGETFRVMHGQAVALICTRHDDVAFVKEACLSCGAEDVEVRSLIVPFRDSRDADWLDDLLGDLSARSNFGTFSREAVTRLIDGQVARRSE
jgi:hypothetical protein